MKNLLALHPLPWTVQPPIGARVFAPLYIANARGETVVTITAYSHDHATEVDREKAALFAAAPQTLIALQDLHDAANRDNFKTHGRGNHELVQSRDAIVNATRTL